MCEHTQGAIPTTSKTAIDRDLARVAANNGDTIRKGDTLTDNLLLLWLVPKQRVNETESFDRFIFFSVWFPFPPSRDMFFFPSFNHSTQTARRFGNKNQRVEVSSDESRFILETFSFIRTSASFLCR